MRLHEEIGPRATTISAIADRAGVQRLTVYRHFPDETAVFQACTAHWLDLNPPPNPAEWAEIADPMERLRAALASLYAYYAGTRRMWTVSHRDVADVPALQGPMEAFGAYVRSIADDLAAGFKTGGSRAVSVTVQHALAFPTFADLDDRQLQDDEKIDLVAAWIRGALG